MPLYFEAVKGYTLILSSVALFPETFTVAPSAVISGILITVTGKYKWALWSGWAISTIGLGLLCLMKVHTSVPAWIFLTLIPGLGFGTLFSALNFAVQASATNKNLAIAVAMFTFFRAFGQAISVAIGGVIFQNRLRANLLGYPTLAPMATHYSQYAAGLVTIIKDMPDGIDKANLKEAYSDSLRIIWVFLCAVSGVAMLLSLLTESYDFNRAPVTNQGMKTKKDGLFDEERKIGDFAMKGCRARKCTKIKIAKEEVPRVARAAVQTVQVSQVLIHGIP
jgi:MFS family permease